MSSVRIKNIEIIDYPDISEPYYKIIYENGTEEESKTFNWHDDLLYDLAEKIRDVSRNYNYRW